VSGNQLSGSIPVELVSINSLTYLDFRYNMLWVTDPAAIAVLNTKDPDWAQTQTVPPAGVAVGTMTASSAAVTWTPILYTGDGGYYEVGYSSTSGGPYTSGCTSADKTINTCTVSGLQPETPYYFAVRTYTPAHEYQPNNLQSVYGAEVSATTLSNIFTSCSAATGIPQSECEALVALYTGTDGTNWTYDDNWLVTNTPCNWSGVFCNAGHVSELNLSDNQLTGPLSPELANLTLLETLSLGNNQLSGPIPPILGSMANLQFFSLTDNLLSGNIPPELSNLDNLTYLNLDRNQLSGSIPAALGNLNSIETLYLDGNRLSGSIPPELGNLPHLLDFSVMNNQLSGNIPPELGTLTNLRGLWLWGNQLTGSIPPELGNLILLRNLYIGSNALAGEIPVEITYLANLQMPYTDLSYNKLTTSNQAVIDFLRTKDPDWASTQTVAPADVYATTLSATSVDVGWTAIAYTGDAGTYEVGYSTTPGGSYTVGCTTANKSQTTCTVNDLLPQTLYYFAARTYTAAHGEQQNNLWSAYSTDVSATTAAEPFTSCSAVTEIPPIECEALVALYESTNGDGWDNHTNWLVTSTPSNWFGVLVNGGHVTEIGLGVNQGVGSGTNHLSGPIPPELGNLSGLRLLHLYNNQLTGSIPPELGNLTNLRTLHLFNNQLTGAIPVELTSLTNMTFLDLGNNQLSGTIPSGIGNLTNLVILNLYSNQLSGSLPPSLGNLTNLRFANFSANQLNGEIPSEIQNISLLDSLGLEYNRLWTSDPAVEAFLSTRDPDWAQTQTVPPLDVAPGVVTSTSISITWTPILYTGDGGYYEVGYSETAGGQYTSGCITASKSASTCIVNDLSPNTTYFLAVRAYTPAHANQQNALLSSYSLEVSTTTGPESLAAPANLAAAVINQGRINLTWDDQSSNESEFHVARLAEGEVEWTPIGIVTADVTSYLDADVTCALEYSYRVRAYRAGDTQFSAYSNTASTTGTTCPPDLLQPDDGTLLNDATPVFRWSEIAGATLYRIRVADTINFAAPLTINTTSTAANYLPSTALDDQEWFWQVQGRGSNGVWSAWSAPQSFTIDTLPPARPVLLAPAQDAATADSTPTFWWQTATDAATYTVQVANNSAFSSPVINRTLATTNYTHPSALAQGHYFWRVRARDAARNWSAWSPTWAFTIDTAPPARPVLTAPANGASTTDHTPTLRWNPVAGAIKYRVQVDNNSDFSSPAINRLLSATSFTLSSVLSNGTYYWRVNAQDAAGNISAWSPRWSFRVTGGAVIPPTLTSQPFTPTSEPTKTLIPTDLRTLTPTPTETVINLLLCVESDQPVVQQTGVWTSHTSDLASGGNYLYSSGGFEDVLSLAFTGTQIEVIYVKHPALGTFAVEVDGVVMQLVDSVESESQFGAKTVVSGLANGQHTARIYPVAGVIALDAFGVDGLGNMAATATPLPTGMPTQDVAPTELSPDQPTLIPTVTSIPLPVALPFVETFDSGLNWMYVGAWTFDTQAAYRGAGWFASSTVRDQNSTLTFGAQIDLRSALNPQMSFWQKMALATEDLFTVEVSTDGGLTWQAVDLQSGLTIDWTQRPLNLSAYRGEIISLRFRLDTLNALPGGAMTMGVWIDELVIQETQLAPTLVPTDVPTATDLPTDTPVPPTDIPTSTPGPTDVPTSTPVPTALPTETPIPTDIPAEEAPAPDATEAPAT
jgi:Leucine-rich repeat (LRR) protein